MTQKKFLSHYFQLLEVFTIREVKYRYKASILGPLWIIIYPIITAVILSMVFGKFIKIKTDGVPYFLFVFSGLFLWNFFEQGLNLAKDSLVWNRELITKTSFFKSTLPVSYILSKIPDFAVYLLVLLVTYLASGYRIDISAILIPLTIVPLILFAGGVALFSSLANAIFRDFGRIIEFSLLLLFYATPIVYPATMIPQKYQFILLVNPISMLIMFVRNLLFRNVINPELLLIPLGVSLLFFILGILFFRKFEKKIADLI